MSIYSTTRQILQLLSELHHPQITRVLQHRSGATILKSGRHGLTELHVDSIQLLGQDLSSHLVNTTTPEPEPQLDLDAVRGLFQNLRMSLVRLNHLGISYSCPNLESELAQLKKHLQGTTFKLYEEPSTSPDNRWFFVGDLTNWEDPLFEIVLTESDTVISNDWVPHFQIDLDTTLPMADLKAMTHHHLGRDFLDWTLDLPGYGIVLGMGQLARVGQNKIYLGLGTEKRPTRYHREHILRPV